MAENELARRASALDVRTLNADLEMAQTPADIKVVVARAQALHDVARRAQLADDQVKSVAAVALRAMRRGGEILNITPRAVGRSSAELPSLATLLEMPASKAKHVAEDWLTVAAVPEMIFEEYLRLPDHIPTRAGLLRYKQPKIKRPAHRPRRGQTFEPEPEPEPEPPPPTRLRVVPQKDDEPEEPMESSHHPALLAAQAEAWNQCVAWFARQTDPRVPDHLLLEAEDSNPYDFPVTKGKSRDR